MTITNFSTFKKKLQNILVEEGIEAAIKTLKTSLKENNEKYAILSQFEIRLRHHMKDRISGILSQEQIELTTNKINNDFLIYLNTLNIKDISIEINKQEEKEQKKLDVNNFIFQKFISKK